MAEELKNSEDINKEDANSASSAPVSVPEKKGSKVESYFQDDVTLVTAPGGSFPVKDDTRRLLALFSDGNFLVCDDKKFDGRVLNFDVLARRKKIKINKAQYVSQTEINNIYTYAARNISATSNAAINQDDNLKMQRDFVSVISKAARQKVSDVHVIVADENTQIMFRANGMMQVEMEYDKQWGEAFVRAAFASADISDANYAQNEYQGAQKLGSTPLRGSKGKLMLPSNILAIRLQFNPIAFGSQYLVMRLLYADDDPDSSGDLSSSGYSEMELDLFYRLRAVPIGLVVVAGPTGSGKSTTLQRNMITLLKERNYECNLITVEDPPEYPIPGARQMPVTNANSEEEKDEQFTKALSASLRSDPDILMVGEICSLSAAQLTFKGALSGHGVWTTLHANSSPAIITRLRDMGVEKFKLADPELVKGLVSQRLFRKLCPHCRISAQEQLKNPSVQRLKKSLGDFGLEYTYLKGKGCQYCNYKGINGRTAVCEIILPDAMFLELLLNGETRKAIDYWTGDLNGRTMKDAAIERMLRGYIDLEEVEIWCGLLDQRPVY